MLPVLVSRFFGMVAGEVAQITAQTLNHACQLGDLALEPRKMVCTAPVSNSSSCKNSQPH